MPPVRVLRLYPRPRRRSTACAIGLQKERRNITQADELRMVKVVDERKRSGERTDLAPDGARFGKSAEVTAAIVGISQRKVERVRSIIDHAKTNPDLRRPKSSMSERRPAKTWRSGGRRA